MFFIVFSSSLFLVFDVRLLREDGRSYKTTLILSTLKRANSDSFVFLCLISIQIVNLHAKKNLLEIFDYN